MEATTKTRVATPKIDYDPAQGSSRPKTIGHILMHTRPGELEAAKRFFEILGCRLKEYGPMSHGEKFYIVEINNQAPEESDNIIFLSRMDPAHWELEKTVREFVGADAETPHPALAAFRKRTTEFPEFSLHVGFHYRSLEDLEAAVLRLNEEIKNNPAFGKHFTEVRVLRANKGDPQIDARMQSSKVFSDTAFYAYGPNLVQVHILTDIVSIGFGFAGTVIELDHVFSGPGRDITCFNNLCLM